MDQNNRKKQNKGGRIPKDNPSIHRHVFRLTSEENTRLLSLFEASGMNNKAKFIISVLFNREIKTVKIDKASMDYYMRLTTLYGQFRAVGVNYNQIVKILYRNFSEKKRRLIYLNLKKRLWKW
jgi:hypothetical protein